MVRLWVAGKEETNNPQSKACRRFENQLLRGETAVSQHERVWVAAMIRKHIEGARRIKIQSRPGTVRKDSNVGKAVLGTSCVHVRLMFDSNFGHLGTRGGLWTSWRGLWMPWGGLGTLWGDPGASWRVWDFRSAMLAHPIEPRRNPRYPICKQTALQIYSPCLVSTL